MNGQSNPELTWPCAKLVEYTRLTNKDWLRHELLVETGTRERFIERAIHVVREEVLAPTMRAEGTVGKRFLLELRRQGYTDEAIARSLAVAWFAHSNHFSLPELENFQSVTRRVLRSFGLALLIVMPGIAYALFADLKPEIQSFFLPLLAGITLLIGIVIYFLHKHHPHFREK